jgi:hypothetical protein
MRLRRGVLSLTQHSLQRGVLTERIFSLLHPDLTAAQHQTAKEHGARRAPSGQSLLLCVDCVDFLEGGAKPTPPD